MVKVSVFLLNFVRALQFIYGANKLENRVFVYTVVTADYPWNDHTLKINLTSLFLKHVELS